MKPYRLGSRWRNSATGVTRKPAWNPLRIFEFVPRAPYLKVNMALQRFTIRNQKAVQFAECSAVPAIQVIAGPNGVGKSTLLYAIKRKIGGEVVASGQMLYIPPHRTWRRQQIHINNLWEVQETLFLSDVLTKDAMQGYPGLRVLDGNRGPDSADEAMSVIKYTLSHFETRRMMAVLRRVDQQDAVRRADIPDIYLPLRRLTEYLLPHLRFSRIDMEARQNIRCLFHRADLSQTLEVELDDLSSGERAIVSLFMPFLEHEIERILSTLDGIAATGEPPKQRDDLIVLMDEPELHLHPALQTRLLDYLRERTQGGGVQFIMVTHSPTLLSAASYDELYVMMPPTGSQSVNQLVRLADSSDRLQAMRGLCGDTYVLTSCRSIICIEGEPPSADVKSPTDLRILEMLCPELKMHVLLPFGGKGNTIQAARRLRELLPTTLPVVSVNALVDADQGEAAGVDPLIIPLPVAMIENLLLVPAAVWAWLEPHRERVRLRGPEQVEMELRAIATERREEEIAIRVQKAIGLHQVRVNGHTVEKLKESLQGQIEQVRKMFPEDGKLQASVDKATNDVDRIIGEGNTLKRFHGKEILRSFHQEHVHQLGIGYAPFAIELARVIGTNNKYGHPLADVLGKLSLPNPGVNAIIAPQ